MVSLFSFISFRAPELKLLKWGFVFHFFLLIRASEWEIFWDWFLEISLLFVLVCWYSGKRGKWNLWKVVIWVWWDCNLFLDSEGFESAYCLWRLREENQGSVFRIILGYLRQIYGPFFEEEVIHFWGSEGLEIYEFPVIIPWVIVPWYNAMVFFVFSFHQMQETGFTNTYSIWWFRFGYCGSWSDFGLWGVYLGFPVSS